MKLGYGSEVMAGAAFATRVQSDGPDAGELVQGIAAELVGTTWGTEASRAAVVRRCHARRLRRVLSARAAERLAG
jgi:hypothetical protein